MTVLLVTDYVWCTILTPPTCGGWCVLGKLNRTGEIRTESLMKGQVLTQKGRRKARYWIWQSLQTQDWCSGEEKKAVSCHLGEGNPCSFSLIKYTLLYYSSNSLGQVQRRKYLHKARDLTPCPAVFVIPPLSPWELFSGGWTLPSMCLQHLSGLVRKREYKKIHRT